MVIIVLLMRSSDPRFETELTKTDRVNCDHNKTCFIISGCYKHPFTSLIQNLGGSEYRNSISAETDIFVDLQQINNTFFNRTIQLRRFNSQFIQSGLQGVGPRGQHMSFSSQLAE